MQRRPPPSSPGARATCRWGVAHWLLPLARYTQTVQDMLKQLKARRVTPTQQIGCQGHVAVGPSREAGNGSEHSRYLTAVIFTGVPVNAQPQRQTLCGPMPTPSASDPVPNSQSGDFTCCPALLPPPEELSKQTREGEGPTEASQMLGTDYHVRSQLTFS